jgi:hypothetical protein
MSTIGDKDAVTEFAWEQFRQCEHYQPSLTMIAASLAEGTSLELVVCAIWKMGFYSAMLAYEHGAIKNIGQQNPHSN